MNVNKNKTRGILGVILAAFAGLANQPSSAQTQQEDAADASAFIEEIIVTATKRSEAVMDVPLAVTAISGEAARDLNVESVYDLIAYTPGVSGDTDDEWINNVNIRGITTSQPGIASNTSVGMFKNNMYQPVQGSFFDIDRSEILRGPQGFLFGRNTISGAFSVHTTRPQVDSTAGFIDLKVGELGALTVEGGKDLPLNDKWAVRIAGYHSEENGHIRDRVSGKKMGAHDRDGGRLTTRYTDDRLDATLFVEYQDREQDGLLNQASGLGDFYPWFSGLGLITSAPPAFREVSLTDAEDLVTTSEMFSIGLNWDYELPWGMLSSTTSYIDYNSYSQEDVGGTEVNFLKAGARTDGDYVEQELRLLSRADAALSWYVGASFYSEKVESTLDETIDEQAYCYLYYPPGSPCDLFAGETLRTVVPNSVHNKGYAAYADLTYDLSERFSVSVGARYAWDKKDFALAIDGSSTTGDPFSLGTLGYITVGELSEARSWDDATLRGLINFYITNDQMLYFSVTQGYKAGGFNTTSINGPLIEVFPGFSIVDPVGVPDTHSPDSYDPETSVSYELGYKAELFDGGAQVTANLYHYVYEDLQTLTLEGARVEVENIGKVKSYGFEGSLTALLGKYLILSAGFSWTDSEQTGVEAACFNPPDRTVCEGQPLPRTPEYTFFAVLNGAYPVAAGEWFGSVSASWEDELNYSSQPPTELTLLEDTTLTQARFGFRSHKNWTLSVFVENLLDEKYHRGVTPDFFTVHSYAQPSRPRLFGARLGYEFD